jgi:DNA-binding CsgD family transcriptional regulator
MAKRKKWTEAEAEFLREHAQDYTAAELARELGCRPTQVYGAVRRLGLSTRGREDKWTSQDRVDLQLYRRQGLTHEEISEKMGRSVDAIRVKSRRIGATRRQVHVPWTDDDVARLHQLFEETKDFREIAAAMGRGYYSIRGKARREGLTIRWTEEEDRVLREMVGRKHYHLIAEQLGRTAIAVQHRCQKLGIGPGNGTHTLREMADILGVSDKYVVYVRKQLRGSWARGSTGRRATDENIVQVAKWILDPANNSRCDAPAARIRQVIKDYGGGEG